MEKATALPNFHSATGFEPVRFMHVCSALQFVIFTYAENSWQSSTLRMESEPLEASFVGPKPVSLWNTVKGFRNGLRLYRDNF